MTCFDEVCSDKLYSEKAKATTENSDCDVYHFEFVDFTRESEAQDMINYFEEKIKLSFETFKVDKSDQIFKIDKIVKTRTGFEVEIKVKKDCMSRRIDETCRILFWMATPNEIEEHLKMRALSSTSFLISFW